MKYKTVCLFLASVMALTMMSVTAAASETAGRTYNVLVINFDPVFSMAGNKRQHELMDWWNDPHRLADEFKKDLNEVSHGYLTYKITDWVDEEELPRATDGRQYSLSDYYKQLITANEKTDGAYWSDSGWVDWGFSFDYDYYMKKYDVYNKVNNGSLYEVWIFGGPMASGMYESHMMGRGAYWCNSPGEEKDCRPFVVYGFNYERGVGEMLEDAGHRAESIMNEVFGWPDYTKNYESFTDWEKFTVYDILKPGMVGVGNVHFAPNSESDYDWGNTTPVKSYCSDWKNYPDLKWKSETVDCSVWGNGDIRLHHKWWFSLFPHVNEFNTKSGKYNNWWYYFSLDYINHPVSAPESFSDVKSTDYFSDAVNWASRQGVTNGIGGGKFGPERTVVRKDAVTFLWRAMGRPEPVSKSSGFYDVEAGSYYEKPVIWAVENGITTGIGGGRFDPDGTLAQDQMLTFIWRTLGEPGKTGAQPWYADSERWAESAGLTVGTGKGYDHSSACPRADVVYYLYRALGK